MRRLLFVFVLIALMVSSCRGEQETPQNVDLDAYNAVIQWPDDPSHIIFQADMIHPQMSEDFFERTVVPECTIYGDGQVVWTVRAEDPLERILTGPIDLPRIRVLINHLVLEDIYNKSQGVGEEIDPLWHIETVRLHVNDHLHLSDIYGGWTREAYNEVVEQCKTLSPRPQIYRPDAIWLRVQEQPYNEDMPAILWEPEVTGVDLEAIAESGQPSWIEGRVVHLLWAYHRRSSIEMQYMQGERSFIIAIEIPNITRFSPPAP